MAELMAAKMYTEQAARWNLEWLVHSVRGVDVGLELRDAHANEMQDVILLGHFCEVEGPMILFRHPCAPPPSSVPSSHTNTKVCLTYFALTLCFFLIWFMEYRLLFWNLDRLL